MKVYYSKDFKGFWPVGTAAVVIAESADEAAALLAEELSNRGLHGGFSVNEIELDRKQALIICDGNY